MPGRAGDVDGVAVQLTYKMRRELRRALDVYTAAIFDVLAHHDTGDGTGVEITAQQLATESNISEKTVRRALTRLAKAGLVKSGSQFRNNRQVANCYHPQYDQLGDGHSDHPGGHVDQANTSTTTQGEQVVTDSHVVTNSLEAVVLPGEQAPEKSKEGLRPSTADTAPKEDSQTEAHKPPAIPWVPRNSPMPPPVRRHPSGGKRYMDLMNSAMWLVTYFEGPVLQRANREAVAKGRKPRDFIPDSRKEKWLDNAHDLVAAYPLHEVVSVIDWIFGTWCGQLPYCVLAERLDYVKPGDLKLTRIVQVQENYDGLITEMSRGSRPDPSAEMALVQRTKINHGKPFNDAVVEARVTELVHLFKEFQLAFGPHDEIHHTRTWRWAKSFRIMLAHRGREFDDLKMVVTTLRDYPEMDRTRYTDAYDLDRGGEWEHVLSAARLARLRSERKPSLGADSCRLSGP
ncbi:MAG: winged helix-turn-helix transcriptional regulator [Candidatus Nanopelagicales bacterium]